MKKQMILLCALCLFGAGVVFGQAYSDLLLPGLGGAQGLCPGVNKTLGDVRPDVVFMGNSITEGWFNQQPESSFRKNNFLGRGIGGQTSSEMLVRFARRDRIDTPQCVAIMAGTNDIAMNNGYIALENTYQNIVSMCELARFNGIKVLPVAPSRRACATTGGQQVEPGKIIPKLNAMLRKYADSAEGVEYVDYFSAMADKDNAMLPGIFARGMPSQRAEGYKVMEKIIVSAINKVNGTDKTISFY